MNLRLLIILILLAIISNVNAQLLKTKVENNSENIEQVLDILKYSCEEEKGNVLNSIVDSNYINLLKNKYGNVYDKYNTQIKKITYDLDNIIQANGKIGVPTEILTKEAIIKDTLYFINNKLIKAKQTEPLLNYLLANTQNTETVTLKMSKNCFIHGEFDAGLPEINMEYALSQFGAKLFAEGSNVKFAYSYLSNTSDDRIGVALDPVWKRILYLRNDNGSIGDINEYDGENFSMLDPQDIAMNEFGEVFVADGNTRRVLKYVFDKSTNIFHIAPNVTFITSSSLIHPVDVDYYNNGTPFDDSDDWFFVVDDGSNSIKKFDLSGQLIEEITSYYGTALQNPKKIMTFTILDPHSTIGAQLAIIDGNRVIIPGSTIEFPLESNLTDIGWGTQFSIIVADDGLNMLHKIYKVGFKYICSYNATSEYHPENLFISSPQCLTNFSNNIVHLNGDVHTYVPYFLSIEKWGQEQGCKMFFPDADVLDLDYVVENDKFLVQFYTTDYTVLRTRLIRIEDNVEISGYEEEFASIPGNVITKEILKSDLELGGYKYVIEYKNVKDDEFGTYSQGYKTKELEIQNIYYIFRTDQTEFDGDIFAGLQATITDQNGATISAPVSQSINGNTYEFAGWKDNILAPNPRTVTPTENTTYIALYKIFQKTDDLTALSNQNQRKIVRTNDGNLHMVYESMDYAWYETSSDGITWQIANGGKPLVTEAGLASKNPSITYQERTVSILEGSYPNDGVLITFQEKTSDNKSNIVVKYFTSGGVATEYISENIESYDADLEPVIGWLRSNGTTIQNTAVVLYKNSSGLHYKIFGASAGVISLDGNSYDIAGADISNYSLEVNKNQVHFFNLLYIQGSNIYCRRISNGSIGTQQTVSSNAKANSVPMMREILDNGSYRLFCTFINSGSQVEVKEVFTDGSISSTLITTGQNVSAVNISPINQNTEFLIVWTENSGQTKAVKWQSGSFTSEFVLGNNIAMDQIVMDYSNAETPQAYSVNTSTQPYSFSSYPLKVETQQLALTANWNWVSFYVDPQNASVNDIFGSTGYTDTDIIKNQLAYAQFLPGNGWLGSLTSFDSRMSYKVWLSGLKNIDLTGSLVDPSTVITLRPNYNWIGYYIGESQSLNNDAFIGVPGTFTPENNDKLVTIDPAGNEYSSYYNGSWLGTLSTLEPSKGYKYFSGASSNKQFTWNDQLGGSLPKRTYNFNLAKNASGWQFDQTIYEHSMYIIADIESEELELNDGNILAIFAGEGIRGLGKPVYIEPLEKYMFFLGLYSNELKDEELTFKLYSSEGNKKFNITTTIQFKANEFLGEIDTPLMLALAEEENIRIPTEFSLNQNYPNPFNPETKIEFAVPKESNVSLIIYNLLGEKVKTLASQTYTPGYYSVYWNGKDETGNHVASGIYVYRIVSEGFVKSRKMLLLK